MMKGDNIIGFRYSAIAQKYMQALNPDTRKLLEGQFHVATDEEVEEAMQLAHSAFAKYSTVSGADRANFLNAIADEILKLGATLINRAMQESGLPEGRITGERGRTVNQLRMFAEVAKEGSWVEASIDTAQPERTPFPKADIRKMLVATGPVLVFTASNFPLAFSTAGGDTASALAAGCPVVVKAHESHLGTNALVAYAIQQAAKATGMPDGVFSSLNGTGPELGQKLVKHPLATAVAFTGSYKAGKAIFDTAAQRANPIPVFAEMGSVNPVILMESALKNHGALAKTYAGSVSLGVGQFCTNPGILIGKSSPTMDAFIEDLGKEMSAISPSTMLNEGICKNYNSLRSKLLTVEGVQLVGQASDAGDTIKGQAAIATVDGATFIQQALLKEEVFGPFTLVVNCATDAEMLAVIESLEGQLTATVMGEAGELAAQKALIHSLQNKVGRIILNGVPTGVEVCESMHHGGPYPATMNGHFTSVGTAAIKRFSRPLAWQNWASDLLPEELKDGNPLGIWRKVDGTFGQV